LKKALICGLLLGVAALLLLGQTTSGTLWLPLLDTSTMRWPTWRRLGTGFAVDATTISVLAAPGTNPIRTYGVRLTVNAQGNYPLPAGAIPSSLVVSVNRLPYFGGIDYDVVGGALVPKYAWDEFGVTDGSGVMVMLDYDK
jgi:hypothetical protein